VSDAYMRETVIRTASSLDCTAAAPAAAPAADAASDDADSGATDAAQPPPLPSAASSTETPAILTFDTHARHTRIRIFLHSFKGAVLCAAACPCPCPLPSPPLSSPPLA
jgi:hypothetical protein